MLGSGLETNTAPYCEKKKNGEIVYSIPDQKLGLANREHNKLKQTLASFTATE